MPARLLDDAFFDRDPQEVAKSLLGKVIRRRREGRWLACAIVEAEAYYKREKGSHASLGRTPSREALFMPAGTIYMYYSRGGDSLNISCAGEGNAVLIKAGRAHVDRRSPKSNIVLMQKLNPKNGRTRDPDELCSGQTLLCRAMDLSVPDWNRKRFDRRALFVEDLGTRPARIIQAPRLGIPVGRDEHLLYRFVDYDQARFATQNPLTKRAWRPGKDYKILVF